MSTRRPSLPIDFFVAMFAISGLLGAAAAYDSTLSTPILAGILLSTALYFLVAHLTPSWGAARGIAMLLVAAAVGFALLFVSQYSYQNYPETPGFILRLGDITTLLPNLGWQTIHPNAAATVLEAGLVLAVLLALTTQRLPLRLVWAVCVLIMLYALGLSWSRGAFVAVGLTLMIGLLCLIPRKLGLLIGAVGVIGALGVLFIIGDRLPLLGDWIASRFELYRNSIYVARDYVFTGSGLGETFALVYSRYGLLIQVPFLTYAHNLPLAAWIGQGILGLFSLVGMALSLYLYVAEVIRGTKPRGIFYAAWLGVTVTLIHGLFDARQYAEALWAMPPLFILMGLTVACGRIAFQEELDEAGKEPGWTLPTLVPVVLFFGMIVLAFFSLINGSLASAWNTNMGALDETRADLAPDLTDREREVLYAAAQTYYETALRTNADYPNANRRLGNLNVALGQFEESVRFLESAAEYEWDNPAAVKGYGLALVWMGQIDEAAEVFHRLADPQAMADELYVWGYYRRDDLGQNQLAAYAWDTAQTMFPGAEPNIDVWLLVANTYRAADDLDNARRWYERIVEVQPGNTEAQNNLESLDD